MAGTSSIPIIDLADAPERAARELQGALTDVGFYYIVNHGVPKDLVRDTYAEVARFHALPLEHKMRVRIDRHNVGYLPMKGDTLRTSVVQTVTKPNLNEALFLARDLPADHPDVKADRRFRSANRVARRPAGLPRVHRLPIATRWSAWCSGLMPLYAGALDLPARYFEVPFRDMQYKLRATHYPPQEVRADDEFGIAPHTDTSFLTVLAPNDVPGLAIRLRDGTWMDAPAIPDAFVVNGGQLLLRWTNDRFLATPHRAVNRSGGERYALAFFCDSNIDWPIAAVPTTVGPDKPPKYPTTYYTDYMVDYQKRTYDLLAAENP